MSLPAANAACVRCRIVSVSRIRAQIFGFLSSETTKFEHGTRAVLPSSHYPGFCGTGLNCAIYRYLLSICTLCQRIIRFPLTTVISVSAAAHNQYSGLVRQKLFLPYRRHHLTSGPVNIGNEFNFRSSKLWSSILA